MNFYLDYDLFKLLLVGSFVGCCAYFFFKTCYNVFFKSK